MYLRAPHDLCPFCIAATNSGATTSKKPLHQFVFHMLSSTLIPLFILKWKRGWKKTTTTSTSCETVGRTSDCTDGESKAIKMTRRQIVCDTSKGLEKAGKLSSATSSSTLRREREEKKTQSRQARAAWSTQAPRDSCALLSASPQTQTQTRPPRLHVQ